MQLTGICTRFVACVCVWTIVSFSFVFFFYFCQFSLDPALGTVPVIVPTEHLVSVSSNRDNAVAESVVFIPVLTAQSSLIRHSTASNINVVPDGVPRILGIRMLIFTWRGTGDDVVTVTLSKIFHVSTTKQTS